MTTPRIERRIGRLRVETGSDIAYREQQPPPRPPAALLVLLHGVGGNESNLAPLAAAAPPDTLVVLPRSRLTLGPGAYGWFHVAFGPDGPRIDAAEADDSRLALIRFVAAIQAQHDVAPRNTVIAGFSQGGILSASVALSAPGRVAGFGLLSGRILPELEPALAPRPELAALRAFIGHGRADDKLPVAWATRAAAWLSALGVPHTLRLYAAGHELDPGMCTDFLQWSAVVAGRRDPFDAPSAPANPRPS